MVLPRLERLRNWPVILLVLSYSWADPRFLGKFFREITAWCILSFNRTIFILAIVDSIKIICTFIKVWSVWRVQIREELWKRVRPEPVLSPIMFKQWSCCLRTLVDDSLATRCFTQNYVNTTTKNRFLGQTHTLSMIYLFHYISWVRYHKFKVISKRTISGPPHPPPAIKKAVGHVQNW